MDKKARSNVLNGHPFLAPPATGGPMDSSAPPATPAASSACVDLEFQASATRMRGRPGIVGLVAVFGR